MGPIKLAVENDPAIEARTPWSFPDLEDVPNMQLEAREHVSAIQNIIDARHDRFPRCCVDTDRFGLRVDNPCETRSGCEVLVQLPGDLGLGVASADDLDGQVGGNRRYSLAAASMARKLAPRRKATSGTRTSPGTSRNIPSAPSTVPSLRGLANATR